MKSVRLILEHELIIAQDLTTHQ